MMGKGDHNFYTEKGEGKTSKIFELRANFKNHTLRACYTFDILSDLIPGYASGGMT